MILRLRHRLPVFSRLELGERFQTTMRVWNLPNIEVAAVWGGGAEFPSMSDRACSRVMRAQQRLSDEQCPLINPSVMDHVQKFGGFTSDGLRKEVWMLVEVKFMTPDGSGCPPLICSVVPDQVDDLLVAASTLDQWVWQRTDRNLRLENIGLTVQRDFPARNVTAQRAVSQRVCSTQRRVVIPPHSDSLVNNNCEDTVASERWFVPDLTSAPAHLLIPEGPIDSKEVVILVRDTGTERFCLEGQLPIGRLHDPNEDQSVLALGLSADVTPMSLETDDAAIPWTPRVPVSEPSFAKKQSQVQGRWKNAISLNAGRQSM